MTPKQFKQLQTKWYRKAASSGFEDIEDGQDRLKTWHSHWFRSRTVKTPNESKYKQFVAAENEEMQVKFFAKQNYYILASQFLDTHTFSTPKEKHIWKMHSEGFQLLEIVRNIKRRKAQNSRTYVAEVIRKLKEIMLHGNQNSRKTLQT